MVLIEELLALVSQYSDYVVWLTIGSSLLFVVILLLVPTVIGSMPDDYFDGTKHPRNSAKKRGIPSVAIQIFRNSFGAILVFLGVLMLILPGQGILTIFVGVLLMNFPGKYRLEKWLISKPKILKMMNWIRKKRGKNAFTL